MKKPAIIASNHPTGIVREKAMTIRPDVRTSPFHGFHAAVEASPATVQNLRNVSVFSPSTPAPK